MATSKKSTSTVKKSSITGKFVRPTTVARHPEATVTQTVTKPKAKPKAKASKSKKKSGQ